ncbi:hypothetical protein SR882_06785 [Guyparkeria halophila]|uniref:Uncharacterized protein n=1 Tax=Guyparkeria halophila TaxID=47960 RepID=A0ABZ0YU07_9GAMM|nr:hypothetical protein [Guyparkeria halophila]WQH15473.1 hypothetical protein SR882_06785 [Guyparkeria halophila]
MLDYFLSSDWAIIATELLAGFIVISLVLAILVWRGQRRHTGAAERLLDDRDPIMRASEEMLERQIHRTWPELTVGDEQRESYAERSLDAIEAMVEPWLEPKRYELAAVARRFLQVRQADLDQLLTLARAHAEQSAGDDPRLGELEHDVKELREQRDRQAKHLAESLETVNVMVREYGRKFDYNDEPHVATVLKAIVMIQEMDAGADCETAKHRADEVFSEDLVASASPPVDESDASVPTGEDSTDAATDQPADQPAEETESDTDTPALSAEDEMAAAMAAEGVSNEKTDAMQAAAQQLEEQATTVAASQEEATRPDSADHSEADGRPAQPTSDETDAETEERAVDATVEQQDASPDTGDIDQLIESAAQAQPETINTPNADVTAQADKTAQTDETETTGGAEESVTPSGGDELKQEQAPPSAPDSADEEVASAQPAEPERQDESESAEPTEARQEQSREEEQEEGENGVIDLDDVEIPKEDEKDKEDGKDEEFDLDDIDALLDAEIARKHGQGSE